MEYPYSRELPPQVPPLTFIAPSELHSHFLRDLNLLLFRAAPSFRELTSETVIYLANDSGFLFRAYSSRTVESRV